MKKRLLLIICISVIFTILVSIFVVIDGYPFSKKPFYVGVTYCGDSVEEATTLIEKVKSYSNLFVLQSGALQDNLTATTEICDYAVNNGLNIIVYYGSLDWKREKVSAFLNVSQNRWGEHFLGIYYGDEPGGKMLDGSQIKLLDEEKNISIWKEKDTITVRKSDETSISFSASGKITLDTTIMYTNKEIFYPNDPISETTIYYPNGTIIVTQRKFDGSISTINYSEIISEFGTYDELWESRPLQNMSEVATLFEKTCMNSISWLQSQSSVKTFTSDYGLYWFDYLGGYDVILAEFGWNHVDIQHMGLVRGAASMQDKDWGAMLTWKSNEAPYLASGEEMLNQMNLAYENGAQYIVIFNYSPNDDDVGLLQQEHFEALKKFWSEKIQDKLITSKISTAEVAYVLPNSYGWGMRNPNDTIWGLWQPDENCTQIWSSLQNALANYGAKLDIIVDDQHFSLKQQYKQVIYWNQTT